MHARTPVLFAVLLGAVFAAGCTTTGGRDDDEDAPRGLDPSTEDQIRTRIANFATLRAMDYQENVEVLGGIMKTYSIPYLIEGLEGASDPKVRGGCAMALGFSRDGRAVKPLHEAMVSDDGPGMRYTAAYNLCLFHDSRGLPVLMGALRDSNPNYRARADEYLKEVTGLDFGFVANDPPEKRDAAADRWEAWYREVGPQGAALQLLPRRSGRN